MVHAGPGAPPSPGAAQRTRCTQRDGTIVIPAEALTAWVAACLQVPSGRPGPFGAILEDNMRVHTRTCTHTHIQGTCGGFIRCQGGPGSQAELSLQGSGLCLVGDHRGLVTDLEAAPLPMSRSCEHLKKASVSLEAGSQGEGWGVSRGWRRNRNRDPESKTARRG